MNIRKKILLYFSVVAILLVGTSFYLIYRLFSEHREEEFQQRQKEKITTTLKFLTEIKKIDEDLITAVDRININDLYDEKLLIYNKDRSLIYSSIDEMEIASLSEVLHQLSAEKTWIEKKEGEYDVVGVYVEKDGIVYYGISKAYDSFGYSKLNFLKYVMLITFVVISIVIILVSYYLSGKLTSSIVNITTEIKNYDFEKQYHPVTVTDGGDEIAVLAQRFNELMKRMAEAYAFQKHAVHHISHELKTPISVLVSNFERMEKETDVERLRKQIKDQKEDTKNLGEIINALLEIAKAESGNQPKFEVVRIDELVFDLVNELNVIYPDYTFSVEYSLQDGQELMPDIMANKKLLKSALLNLMVNSIQYNNVDSRTRILIGWKENRIHIELINYGETIREEERRYIFQHFFRGENSKGKRGFGLGLVLVHKIIILHGGTVTYTGDAVRKENILSVNLPLS